MDKLLTKWMEWTRSTHAKKKKKDASGSRSDQWIGKQTMWKHFGSETPERVDELYTCRCTDENESLVLAPNEHYWRVLDIANQKTRMRGSWCTGVEKHWT